MKAKAAGNTEVPNLQESLVEVHVHSGTLLKAALLGQGSSSGPKGPKAGLIELRETTIRKDIEINMTETLINSIDSMESDNLVRTMMEFGSKALILSRRVGTLYRRELKEGNHEELEDLQRKVNKFAKKKMHGRRIGKNGKRRKRGWGPGRFAVWIQRRSLRGE